MKDYKFANEELKKCIECCIKAQTLGDCIEMKCPASTKQGCQFYLRTDDDRENIIYVELLKDALDFINRQESEVEKLIAEVIQDFAKELKESCTDNPYVDYGVVRIYTDDLVKKYTESGGTTNVVE